MKVLCMINSHGQKVLGKEHLQILIFPHLFIYAQVHVCAACVYGKLHLHISLHAMIYMQRSENSVGVGSVLQGPGSTSGLGLAVGNSTCQAIHLTVLISLKYGLPLPSQPLVFHVFKSKCPSRFLSGCYIII